MKNSVFPNKTNETTKTQIPVNLSGIAFIKPKNVRKNHSGIILSDVFDVETISKLSSWKTKNQYSTEKYV
mgnify:CR=1 FL=1